MNNKYKNGQYKFEWDGVKCSESDKETYTGDFGQISTDSITGLDIKQTDKTFTHGSCSKIPDDFYTIFGDGEPVCGHLNASKINGSNECEKYYDGYGNKCVERPPDKLPGSVCIVSNDTRKCNESKNSSCKDIKPIPDNFYKRNEPNCEYLNLKKINGIENCENYYDGSGNPCVSGSKTCVTSINGPCRPP